MSDYQRNNLYEDNIDEVLVLINVEITPRLIQQFERHQNDLADIEIVEISGSDRGVRSGWFSGGNNLCFIDQAIKTGASRHSIIDGSSTTATGSAR